MDDISPGGRRMTYAELGAARGISAASAERLVRRRRWQRQVGNDGVARVLVPIGEDQKAEHVRPGHPGRSHGETSSVTSGRDITAVIWEAIREVVTPLSAQLESAEQGAAIQRAELADLRIAEQAANNLAEIATAQAGDLRKRLEAAEQRMGEERSRADRAEQRADRLHGELDAAQAAERKAIELVKYATADASEQRRRADDAVDAERIAREEAAGLRADLEARRNWGLRRRLRWALGRKR